MDREKLLPGHRGTMEEQGIRREGHMHPHIQDPHHAARLPAQQGCAVQWVPAQDTVICSWRAILHIQPGEAAVRHG